MRPTARARNPEHVREVREAVVSAMRESRSALVTHKEARDDVRRRTRRHRQHGARRKESRMSSSDSIGRGSYTPPADWTGRTPGAESLLGGVGPDEYPNLVRGEGSDNPDSPVSSFPRASAILQPYADALVTMRTDVSEMSELIGQDAAAVRRAADVLNLTRQHALHVEQLEAGHDILNSLVFSINDALARLANVK